MTKERNKPIPPALSESELLRLYRAEQVDPGVAADCFNAIIKKEHDSYPNKGGRPATRVKRVWKKFQGRENAYVSLEEMADAFADRSDPLQSAFNVANWLNGAFEKRKLNLEIKSIPARSHRSDESTTYYYLRHKHPPK